MKTIQNNLRHYRELKGLTQQQVADYLGFKSSSRIAKWEKGVMYPHVRHFVRLVELFEVTPKEIYEEILIPIKTI